MGKGTPELISSSESEELGRANQEHLGRRARPFRASLEVEVLRGVAEDEDHPKNPGKDLKVRRQKGKSRLRSLGKS